MQLKDCLLPSLSIKEQQVGTLDLQLERLLRYLNYLRLLYARVGRPICPIHGIEITSQTIEQMVDRIMVYPERTRLQVLAPIISGRKGTHAKVLEDIKKQGFVRVRVNGEMVDLSEEIELEKNKKNSIEVIVDRIVVKEGGETRLADSLETALDLGEGKVIIDIIGEEELLFSQNHACPECGFSIDNLEPRMFSFNSPYGACPDCDGLGSKLEVDLELIIPDWSLTLNEDAIAPWTSISSQYYPQLLKTICDHYNISMDVPVEKLPKKDIDKIRTGQSKKQSFFSIKTTSDKSLRGKLNLRVLSIMWRGAIRKLVLTIFVNRWKNIWRSSHARDVKGIG